MPDEYSAIRQLCERYVDAINRRDAEAWLETWAPDGVWEYGGEHPPRGLSQLARFWERAMADMSAIVMVVNSGVIDAIDGDSARARWYHTERVQIGEDRRMEGVTVYEDDLVRMDGRWLFAKRTHTLLYSNANLYGLFYPYQPGSAMSQRGPLAQAAQGKTRQENRNG